MNGLTPIAAETSNIASKAEHAIAMVTRWIHIRTLAREERPYGVRANTVAHGLVATNMGRWPGTAIPSGGHLDELDATFPFGRVCRPECRMNSDDSRAQHHKEPSRFQMGRPAMGR